MSESKIFSVDSLPERHQDAVTAPIEGSAWTRASETPYEGKPVIWAPLVVTLVVVVVATFVWKRIKV